MPRPKGSLNKATVSAREAIGAFVDANSYQLQGWLDQIATGVPKPGDEGEYIINPNPAKAFVLGPDPQPWGILPWRAPCPLRPGSL